MSPDEVLEVVRKKAVEVLEVPADDVQREKSFVRDLEVDSLSLVEFTMDLEDELGVEISEEDLDGVDTIGAFVDLLARRTS